MIKRVAVLIVAVVVILSLGLFVGCSRPTEQAPPTGPVAGLPAAPAPGAATPATGTIRQVGSTTVLPLAEKWRSEFNKKNPSVSIAVSGGGTGTGIKALISKTAEIADASREIKAEEKTQAEAAGVKPVERLVAYDGIAIIVNPANTLTKLPLEKLSDLYTGKVTKWDEVGGKGVGDVQLVNRDSSSGTYDAFKEMVVQLGGKDKTRDFAPGTLNQTSNEAVLTMVAQTKTAIGYVGLGYVNSSVKVLGIIPAGGKDAVLPSAATVLSKKYPVSRALYCYTDGEPTGDLKAYLDYMVSDEGQALVKELGFIPLNGETTKAAPAKPTS